MGNIITGDPMIIMDTEFGCLMGCTRLESNLAANSRVLIGTSSKSWIFQHAMFDYWRVSIKSTDFS